MPTSFLPGALRAQLFSLPPSLRTAAYQAATTRFNASRFTIPRRALSASAPTRAAETPVRTAMGIDSTLADLLVQAPCGLLDTFHFAGIPWYATIPLVAILVRGVFGYYFCSLPLRKNAMIHRHLGPYTSMAALSQIRKSRENLLFENPGAGKVIAGPVGRLVHATSLFWMGRKRLHNMGKRFGAPLYTWRNFANFAAMLTVVEAVRRKCGASRGLLSAIGASFEGLSVKLTSIFSRNSVERPEAAAAAPVESISREEALAEKLWAQRKDIFDRSADDVPDSLPRESSTAVPESPSVSTSYQHTDVGGNAVEPSSWQIPPIEMDPALQSEGLSWCPDLTLTDPTYILPLTLCATMIASNVLRPAPPTSKPTSASAPSNEDDAPQSRFVTKTGGLKFTEKLNFGQKLGLSMSLLFLVPAMQLPAGVVLYLISTFATGWLQGRWLDLKYPLPVKIEPCKRPLRRKVRGEVRDV